MKSVQHVKTAGQEPAAFKLHVRSGTTHYKKGILRHIINFVKDSSSNINSKYA